MEPNKTLKSCGISSMLYRRRNAPTRVTRGSSRILNSTPFPSFWSASWLRSLSASTTIDRNFHMWNGMLLSPMRSAR
ncbi:Uncharacterised protein [Mycobacteroides abscessus subsp. abscessus]|nr:Uncharacterised protein [Mycobacteroides abscessus subsp. abscessus]